jgi:hypothetical protein
MHVIDKKSYESLKEMILSKDEENIKLALSIIHNADMMNMETVHNVNMLNAHLYQNVGSWNKWVNVRSETRKIFNNE